MTLGETDYAFDLVRMCEPPRRFDGRVPVPAFHHRNLVMPNADVSETMPLVN